MLIMILDDTSLPGINLYVKCLSSNGDYGTWNMKSSVSQNASL